MARRTMLAVHANNGTRLRLCGEGLGYDVLEFLGKGFPIFAQVAMKMDMPHENLLAGSLAGVINNLEIAILDSRYIRIEKNAALAAISLGIGIELVNIGGPCPAASAASREPFPFGVQNKPSVVFRGFRSLYEQVGTKRKYAFPVAGYEMALPSFGLGVEPMLGETRQRHHPFSHKGGHEGFKDLVHIEQQRKTALFSCIRRRRTGLEDEPAKMEHVRESLVLSRNGYLLEQLIVDRYIRNAVQQ